MEVKYTTNVRSDFEEFKVQLLYINVQRFSGGLICKAHGLVYDSTVGWRVINERRVQGAESRTV